MGSDTKAEYCRDLAIVNRRGLHARASAKFVQLADSFEATITVSKDQNTVGGTSIMGLMMLAAGIGSSIRVTAEGPDAGKAIEAIAALVANRFGEEE
ncbi:HPr family phosphocarrier protein [Kaistia geumhonensis]|uniref:Phosphocarrier protein n=1 Tax=Kaistia geumhonensis TaxID=410839 RepID=A0ABU0M7J7_9HYPH|nr:HPr family phosphocarrier protein [Kaistia geumhonensis]MCX5477885.1 HPr family phosphocarrier protein [Kaistia geumhonensis]MDQ0516902.1 phosphocarrier protein [Kaistia geumhonensis]